MMPLKCRRTAEAASGINETLEILSNRTQSRTRSEIGAVGRFGYSMSSTAEEYLTESRRFCPWPNIPL